MGMLSNKIAFISGASSGIGKACAIDFAREGADLIISARRIERINELAEILRKDFGVKVLAFQLDVRNFSKVKEAINNLPDQWKNIDVLVNNAGLARGLSKIQDGDVEHWEEMIDTNLKGLLYVTRNILPLMTKRKSGHVINIGSIAGHEIYPSGNVYCASKFAVKALTKAMRIDLFDQNIRVSTVDPGMVETEFSEVRLGDKEKAAKVYEGFKPLSAQDISNAVLFCATRPPHVNISEVIIMGTDQASTTLVNRK